MEIYIISNEVWEKLIDLLLKRENIDIIKIYIQINLNNQTLISKNNMNVIGVEFDSKLKWQNHITNTIAKDLSENTLTKMNFSD